MSASGQPRQFAVLADDLTGALDCAAAFLSSGFSPFVSIDGTVGDASGADLVSLDMDTRRMDAHSAAASASESTRGVIGSGAAPVYVKIDSTMRGHPGVEIGAVARSAGARIAIVCPAFPSTGRTARAGTLFVHGAPLAETEVGRDPLSPAKSSRVSDLLDCRGLETAEVALEAVRGDGLVPALDMLGESGLKLVSCDAETDEDLDRIARAARHVPGALLAGSAGLAGALARVSERSGGASHVVQANLVNGPVMVVTASQRSLADRQIAEAASSHGLVTVDLEFQVDQSGHVSAGALDANAVESQLARGIHTALRVRIAGDLAAMAPPDVRRLADDLVQKLGEITAGVCETARPGALALIGGDTAHGVLSGLGAHGIFLRSQPLPGVPVGVISGGLLDGVTVATKAGAFGDDMTLTRLFDFLLNGRAER